MSSTRKPRVVIEYCKQCRWMLRAAWFAQELLTTFADDLGEVALQPSTGGAFFVRLVTVDPTSDNAGGGDEKEVLLWDRKAQGGFPEAKQLKQLVRDVIQPQRSLGHSDKPVSDSTARATGTSNNSALDDTKADTTSKMSSEQGLDWDRAKRAVDGHDESGADGPVNTLDEKPASNTTTAYAKAEAEELPDGPVSRIDDNQSLSENGAERKGVHEIKKEAKPLDGGAVCKDCE